MKYCCEKMKHADEKGIIDYCPGHLTTIETKTVAYPVHFCPFCGKELKGTGKSVKRIRKYFGKKRGEGEGGRTMKRPSFGDSITRFCKNCDKNTPQTYVNSNGGAWCCEICLKEGEGEGGRAMKCEDEVIKELREVEKDFRGRSKEPEVMKERYLEGWRDALRWIIGEEG